MSSTNKNDQELRYLITHEVLTTAEVADCLKTTKQYVQYLIKEEKLVPVKKDRSINLFLKKDVEKIMQNRTLAKK